MLAEVFFCTHLLVQGNEFFDLIEVAHNGPGDLHILSFQMPTWTSSSTALTGWPRTSALWCLETTYLETIHGQSPGLTDLKSFDSFVRFVLRYSDQQSSVDHSLSMKFLNEIWVLGLEVLNRKGKAGREKHKKAPNSWCDILPLMIHLYIQFM